MAKSLKTEAAPILTADGKPIKVGDVLYGVDRNCHSRDMPKIEPLRAIQMDLGARREVRLRRVNGIEWTWSANGGTGGACIGGDKLLYSAFSKARAVAVDVARRNRQDYERQVKREEDDFKAAEQDLERAKKKLASFDKQLSKVRNMKAPAELPAA